MYSDLIVHSLKESLRTGIWQRKLLINLILGFFLLYGLATFLVIGYFLDEVLMNVFPSREPLSVFNSFLLYYLVFDLFFRIKLQQLPVLKIEPYRHLPISKRGLAHFLLIKTLPSVLNIFPLLIILPFFIKSVVPTYGILGPILWLMAVIAMVYISNFVMMQLKRKMSTKAFGIAALVLAVIGGLQYYELIDVPAISQSIFDSAVQGNPITPLVLLATAVLAYQWNFRETLRDFYFEDARHQTVGLRSDSKLIGWLTGRGEIGYLVATELRLIARNKRPRTVAAMGLTFLFYGLIFYTQGDYDERYTFLIFVGTFTTGGFLINYGQYIFSWESSYMDLLNVQRLPLERYIGAKWMLIAMVLFITWILSLAYGFLSPYYLWLHSAMFIYNIGFNSFVVLVFCTYNKKRIELSKGGSFNWQGVGAAQWLIALPLIALPMIIFFPFSLFGMQDIGLMVLVGIGLTSLACYPLWVRLIADNLRKRKYIMLDGYRKSA